MWSQLLFLLAATAAATAIEDEDFIDYCRIRIYRECETVHTPPEEMPGTAEEFEELCKYGDILFECAERVIETCSVVDDTELAIFQDVSSNARRVCNKDSLLYSALVESLPCFKTNFQGIMSCHETYEEHRESVSEALAAIGMTDLEETEEGPIRCLRVLYGSACTAARIGKFCGDVARDVFLNVTQGFDTPFKSCPPGAQENLLDIAKVIRMELEKGEAVESKIKKKK